MNNTDKLHPEESKELLIVLKKRFEQNMDRHKGLQWAPIQAKLEAYPEKLRSLHKMEETGGEPDVVRYDKATEEYVFYDCSPESPKGRRSICYDLEALESRNQHKPHLSPRENATEIGIDIPSEEQYLELQQFRKFDPKTSSWVKTPIAMRASGGALFGDWRYGRVFFYHNGAES